MFYLSAYLERNRAQYYHALHAISEKDDWNGWIRFFLTAVVEQAKENIKKARAILNLYEKMKQDVPTITRSQYAIQAIDTIFYRPVFSISDFSNRSGIPLPTAKRIVENLKKEKLLNVLSEGKGRKSSKWVFAPLLAIVNITEEETASE
jgi:Fic family protein